MIGNCTRFGFLVGLALFAAGCTPTAPPLVGVPPGPESQYIIGPGDAVNIFIYRVPELSVEVPVRPDGLISTPLVPDVIATAKGLGAGYAAIGAVLCTDHVYQAFAAGSRKLTIGHTWDGAPLSCAVGLKVLEIMRDERLIERVRERGPSLRNELASALKRNPLVREVRGDCASALELFESVPRRYPAGDAVPQAQLERGRCLRILGRKDEAKSVLNQLAMEHPHASETAQSRQLLQDL